MAFEELVFNYEFPTGDIAFPYPDECTRRSSATSAGRPSRHTELHRCGRGKQLRRAHGGVDRRKLSTAQPLPAERRRSRRVPAWRRLRTCDRARTPSSCGARSAAFSTHPNVSAAVIVGLGCEVNQITHYLGDNAPRTDRLIGLTLQESGGTRAHCRGRAPRDQPKFIEQAAPRSAPRYPPRISLLGLNCGGSDSFSGITANPALGVCSDMLAEIGATAVLAETTETFGAEHLLVRRARNRAVAEKYLGFIKKLQAVSEPLRRKLR